MSRIEDFDFIVIGAGMAGASVAAELAQSSRVAIIEKEERPGYHATGRSAAMHSETYGSAAVRALSRASRQFFEIGDGERSFFSCRRGFLHVARAEQTERLRAYAMLPDIAAATRTLSAQQACEMVQVLRPSYVVAALLEPEAFDLDVDAIHQFYLRQAQRHGTMIYCGASLIDAGRVSDQWMIALAGRTLQAPVVINAAGAWGDEIARLIGAAPVGLQPLRRTALLVERPPDTVIDDWPLVIDIDEQFYFKPDAGRILLSPADESLSEPCDAYPEEIDIAVAVDRVQRAADIPVKRVLHSWAGLRTFGPDRQPIIGHAPDTPGFFWLVGQGGYGIQIAPALAKVAAALALDREIPAEIVDQGLNIADILVGKPAAADGGAADQVGRNQRDA